MPPEPPAGAGANGKDTASFVNPSTRTLFDHWKSTFEAEIMGLIKEGESIDLGDLAKRMNVSAEVVDIFVRNLIEEGKLRIRTVSIS